MQCNLYTESNNVHCPKKVAFFHRNKLIIIICKLPALQIEKKYGYYLKIFILLV